MVDTETAVPEEKTLTENLTGHVADYADTYIRLAAIKATQKATDAATLGFTAVMISFFGMIVAIFLGLGTAKWLAENMSEKEAYFIVTGIYTAVGGIILLFRRTLVFPYIQSTIIKRIYEGKNADV